MTRMTHDPDSMINIMALVQIEQRVACISNCTHNFSVFCELIICMGLLWFVYLIKGHHLRKWTANVLLNYAIDRKENVNKSLQNTH